MSVRPSSVGWLVGWSVGRSVGPSRSSRKVGKHAFPPLPTRPRLVLAVYPALFFLCFFSSLLDSHSSELPLPILLEVQDLDNFLIFFFVIFYLLATLMKTSLWIMDKAPTSGLKPPDIQLVGASIMTSKPAIQRLSKLWSKLWQSQFQFGITCHLNWKMGTGTAPTYL